MRKRFAPLLRLGWMIMHKKFRVPRKSSSTLLIIASEVGVLCDAEQRSVNDQNDMLAR